MHVLLGSRPNAFRQLALLFSATARFVKASALIGVAAAIRDSECEDFKTSSRHSCLDRTPRYVHAVPQSHEHSEIGESAKNSQLVAEQYLCIDIDNVMATAEQMQEAVQQQQHELQVLGAMETQLQFEPARAQQAEQERSALIQTLGAMRTNRGDAMVDTKGIVQPFTLKGGADDDFGGWTHKVRTFMLARFGDEELYDRLLAYSSTKQSIQMGESKKTTRKDDPMDVGALSKGSGKGKSKGKGKKEKGQNHMSNVTCWNCGKKGHYARNCSEWWWSRGKGKRCSDVARSCSAGVPLVGSAPNCFPNV